MEISTRFRKQWELNIIAEVGQLYEADTHYIYKNINNSIFSGSHNKFNFNLSTDYSYCYNYLQKWIANQLTLSCEYAYFPISPLSLSVSITNIAEWDTAGLLFALTPYLTPRIEYKFNSVMGIDVYSQLVFQKNTDNFQEPSLFSNRIGILFSWNFRPKSWLYLAFNNFEQIDEYNQIQLINRIGAIKLRYLIYF
jgi:hypothetical protein